MKLLLHVVLMAAVAGVLPRAFAQVAPAVQPPPAGTKDLACGCLSEHWVNVTFAPGLFAPKPFVTKLPIQAGSCFPLELNGKVLWATAAHVVLAPCDLQPPRMPSEIANLDGKVFKADKRFTISTIQGSSRIRVSGMSFRPVRQVIDRGLDIALFELNAEDCKTLLERVELRPLRVETPRRDLGLAMWGFPTVAGPLGNQILGTPFPVRGKIASVDVGSKGFTVATDNGSEIASGMSGGPVLDEAESVAGVIIESIKMSVTCRAISEVSKLAQTFDAKAEPYVDGQRDVSPQPAR